jgi:hypothetical protein
MRSIAIRCLLLAALGAAAPACKTGDSNGLSDLEIDYLAEDVDDLMTIAFAIGESAYLGDVVSSGDVIEEASPGNGYFLTYDLPPGFRLGLGPGYGRVRLSVTADGVPLALPDAFSFATTDALDVEIHYEIDYVGETFGGRSTDVQFAARLVASRVTPQEPFMVEYIIDGDCYLDETYCRYTTWIDAEGLPHDLLAEQSDAEGFIDDPDVFGDYDLDIDYRSDGTYVAEGWVGCCSWFREKFILPR